MGGDKNKKMFYQRLNKVIEDNMRLKLEQQKLKDVNKEYLKHVGNKEREVKSKNDFLKKASRELDHREVKYMEIKLNFEKLDERERKNHANLKGLIAYAKKLTLELDQQRDKVQMAENIIKDLKQAGSDNIDSLMNLLESYKLKQHETSKEIKKLNQLIVLKDNEIVGLDEDIHELNSYLGTAKDKLELKI